MELMTVQQAAEILQLHPETVRRKIKEKRLKAYVTGKSYRITQQQLEDYLIGDENDDESG